MVDGVVGAPTCSTVDARRRDAPRRRRGRRLARPAPSRAAPSCLAATPLGTRAASPCEQDARRSRAPRDVAAPVARVSATRSVAGMPAYAGIVRPTSTSSLTRPGRAASPLGLPALARCADLKAIARARSAATVNASCSTRRSRRGVPRAARLRAARASTDRRSRGRSPVSCRGAPWSIDSACSRPRRPVLADLLGGRRRSSRATLHRGDAARSGRAVEQAGDRRVTRPISRRLAPPAVVLALAARTPADRSSRVRTPAGQPAPPTCSTCRAARRVHAVEHASLRSRRRPYAPPRLRLLRERRSCRGSSSGDGGAIYSPRYPGARRRTTPRAAARSRERRAAVTARPV